MAALPTGPADILLDFLVLVLPTSLLLAFVFVSVFVFVFRFFCCFFNVFSFVFHVFFVFVFVFAGRRRHRMFMFGIVFVSAYIDMGSCSVGGVFAVLVTPCDYRDPMGLVGEASPDKRGRLHSLQLEN